MAKIPVHRKGQTLHPPLIVSVTTRRAPHGVPGWFGVRRPDRKHLPRRLRRERPTGQPQKQETDEFPLGARRFFVLSDVDITRHLFLSEIVSPLTRSWFFENKIRPDARVVMTPADPFAEGVEAEWPSGIVVTAGCEFVTISSLRPFAVTVHVLHRMVSGQGGCRCRKA